MTTGRSKDQRPLAHLTDWASVAAYVNTSPKQLQYLLRGRPEEARYVGFTIPKRRGGVRTILAPCKDLKSVQRRLAAALDDLYEPRAVAFGFIKGRSIVDCARQHEKRRHVLNVDIRDFFPSIHFGRVRGLFRRCGASAEASLILAQICCHQGVLPQGAPTSPVVSNMICVPLDRQLQALAGECGCLYSRYVDDLTFSSRRGAFSERLARLDKATRRAGLGDDLLRVLEHNSFEPNATKIWLFDSNQRQTVTGLTVNAKPNVRREWVRELRAMLNAWHKYGLDAAQARFESNYWKGPSPAPDFASCVRGKLDFLRMVKGPDDQVYRGLQKTMVLVDPSYASVMRRENEVKKQRDVFLSHASEDKATLVAELADCLIKLGVSVWYDEYSIGLGDDIRAKIDEGLANSRAGVVVLSPAFLRKLDSWPGAEYSVLFGRQMRDASRRMFPIWHNLQVEDVAASVPPLADRKALLTKDHTVPEMAARIAKAVRAVG